MICPHLDGWQAVVDSNHMPMSTMLLTSQTARNSETAQHDADRPDDDMNVMDIGTGIHIYAAAIHQ